MLRCRFRVKRTRRGLLREACTSFRHVHEQSRSAMASARSWRSRSRPDSSVDRSRPGRSGCVRAHTDFVPGQGKHLSHQREWHQPTCADPQSPGLQSRSLGRYRLDTRCPEGRLHGRKPSRGLALRRKASALCRRWQRLGRASADGDSTRLVRPKLVTGWLEDRVRDTPTRRDKHRRDRHRRQGPQKARDVLGPPRLLLGSGLVARRWMDSVRDVREPAKQAHETGCHSAGRDWSSSGCGIRNR